MGRSRPALPFNSFGPGRAAAATSGFPCGGRPERSTPRQLLGVETGCVTMLTGFQRIQSSSLSLSSKFLTSNEAACVQWNRCLGC
ncbi:zinc finger BED domain-containing protein 4 isoform X2 [Aquila chrysaetos chrysaetos]|uniref:zinc finger BED domain-containing protein 4 isoform X2 n=1 Tax=Aquila chrysaetos chrysaetos TaxID=223781 RepID=UPI001B7D374D|nr:zinc finger BED domain-containing protein 4 isoform X2 [Aquila chrysaetos chrysaetos]